MIKLVNCFVLRKLYIIELFVFFNEYESYFENEIILMEVFFFKYKCIINIK